MFAPHLLALEFILLAGAFFFFKNVLEKRRKKSEVTPQVLVKKFHQVREEAEEALTETEQTIRDAQRDRKELLELVEDDEKEVVEESVSSAKTSDAAKAVAPKVVATKTKSPKS